MFVGVTCGHEFWGLPTYRLVEELGYDGVFCGEHLMMHRPVWDAVSMTTAMACATERIVDVPAPPRRPPKSASSMLSIGLKLAGRSNVTFWSKRDMPTTIFTVTERSPFVPAFGSGTSPIVEALFGGLLGGAGTSTTKSA